MEKSKQKPFAKSKAIFNLIFPTEKIKTADKMNADASKPKRLVHFTAIAVLFANLTLLRLSLCIFDCPL
jgi:hypothetical protein